jgi:sulfur-oxidizing protein SoxY
MTTRRTFIAGAALVSVLPLSSARATPEAMAAGIKEVVGDNAIREGPCHARPAALDRKRQRRAAHRVGREPDDRGRPRQGDPRLQREEPAAARLRCYGWGQRNGKAAVGTRIKLGDSQKIVAIAETSKGEFFSASADVIVTLAACLEDLT